ncbi:MAG TPA: response regulator [Vicinamibacteria bacterium]|nr:response regulator [Vicinamibacteria bacterium]
MVEARRVLVADDNVDSAETLAMLLQALGNEVRTVNDGTQAVEESEQFRPHVVLLDIGMPGLDGYEVARLIRGRPWGAQVVLIALTGFGEEEDRRRSREAGFDHHLLKPVDIGPLRQALEAAPPSA